MQPPICQQWHQCSEVRCVFVFSLILSATRIDGATERLTPVSVNHASPLNALHVTSSCRDWRHWLRDPIEIPHVAFVKKTIYPSHHQGWAEAIKANDQVIRPRYSLKSTGCSIDSTVKINVSTTQEGLDKSRQNIIHAKKRYCTDIYMLMQHRHRWRQVPTFQVR